MNPLPAFPGPTRLPAAIIELTGPDAGRYLEGQITCHVGALTPGGIALACVTNHKGRLDAAPVHVRKLASDRFVLDAPIALRETLLARLERYIVADDCELRDRTEEWALHHGPRPESGTAGAALAAGANPYRFGTPTWDVLVTADAAGNEILRTAFGGIEGTPGAAASATGPAARDGGEAVREFLRVVHGIPAWESEATPEILAPEIPFLRDHAISYTKGCYIGQEVISRIRSVGRVNKSLALLLPAADGPDAPPSTSADPAALVPAAGDPLFVADNAGSGDVGESGRATAAAGDVPPAAIEVGRITTVARLPEAAGGPSGPRFAALGFVARGQDAIGSLLRAASAKNMLSCRLEIGNTPPVASDH